MLDALCLEVESNFFYQSLLNETKNSMTIKIR